MYRQGDVLIVAVDEVPDRTKAVARDRGRIVLAYGEVTGHTHAIADRGAELVESQELQERFLRVLAEGGVTLTHEEHAPVVIPEGTYRVVRQREYTPETIRNVAD
ncbi:MAG: hypothetical protein ACRDIX_07220 [Actinomycetota bacterium]